MLELLPLSKKILYYDNKKKKSKSKIGEHQIKPEKEYEKFDILGFGHI